MAFTIKGNPKENPIKINLTSSLINAMFIKTNFHSKHQVWPVANVWSVALGMVCERKLKKLNTKNKKK